MQKQLTGLAELTELAEKLFRFFAPSVNFPEQNRSDNLTGFCIRADNLSRFYLLQAKDLSRRQTFAFLILRVSD